MLAAAPGGVLQGGCFSAAQEWCFSKGHPLELCSGQLSLPGLPESGAIPCHAFLCRAVIKMSLRIPTTTSGSVPPSGFPMIAGFMLCTRHPLQADPVCLSGGPRNKIVLNRSQVLFSLQFTHLDPRRVQPYDYAERSLDRLLSLFAE